MSSYYNMFNSHNNKVSRTLENKLDREKHSETMDNLLFDLLSTVSPSGKEDKISDIIMEWVNTSKKQLDKHLTFVRDCVKVDDYTTDKERNLIYKIGKNPTVMFSAHMDTVQSRNINALNNLHYAKDGYVAATCDKYKTYYIDANGQQVTESDIQKEYDKANPSAFVDGYILLKMEKDKRQLFVSENSFDDWQPTGMTYKVEKTIEPSDTILGADDKLGCYTLCKLMAAGVEGLYVFHTNEESGGLGSSYLAKHKKELFTDINYCIAFDRKGYNEVITRQSGGTCCSTEFATALSKELNQYVPPKEQYEPSPNGSFTDSANYTDLIPECTNVSVGYFHQHSSSEYFDAEWFLNHFIPAVCKVEWSKLPVVRDPSQKIQENTWSNYYGRNYTSQSHRYPKFNRHFGDGDYGVSKAAKKLATYKRKRKAQSVIDKAHSAVANVEEFNPETKFAEGLGHQQKVNQVLYTFINQDMSMSDIAEMIVDLKEDKDVFDEDKELFDVEW